MEKSTDQTSPQCRNCGAAMPEKAAFCPNCGQKHTSGRISLGHLLANSFEAVFNFDSKIFQTLRDIFIPGKLTQQYFMGRHQRYLAPVRFLFFMTIIHLATISFVIGDDLERLFRNMNQEQQLAGYQLIFKEQLDTLRQGVAKEFPDQPAVSSALDTLVNRFGNQELDDSLDINILKFKPGGKATFEIIPIAYKDLETLPVDSILQVYTIQDWRNQLQIRQFIKLITESSNFSRFVLGNLTWMILLMMPALAFLLKLLYIRRDFYFVEHLVFSFHYHAFAFLVMSVGYLLDHQFDADRSYSSIGLLIVLVYLFIAMRRFYQQRGVKTFLKFIILNSFYLVILLLFIVLTLMISAAFY